MTTFVTSLGTLGCHSFPLSQNTCIFMLYTAAAIAKQLASSVCTIKDTKGSIMDPQNPIMTGKKILSSSNWVLNISVWISILNQWGPLDPLISSDQASRINTCITSTHNCSVNRVWSKGCILLLKICKNSLEYCSNLL